MLKGPIGRQVKEGTVRHQLAVGKPKFTQALALANEGSDRLITNIMALMEIDFKDIWAVLGKGKDGTIFELLTIVEFKLEGLASLRCNLMEPTYSLDVLAVLCNLDHGLVGDLLARRSVEAL